MSFIVNGTSGLTLPDATNQTSAFLNPGSTSGAPLVSNGTSWTRTTPVGVAFGGTGLTSPGASGNILTSNGTAWVSSAAPAGGVTSFNTRTGAVTLASGDVTTALGYTPPQANGTGASGTWAINVTGSAATATTATNVSGTVGVANGGTGLTAPGTSGNVLTSNGTGWVSSAPAAAPTQLAKAWANFTGSTSSPLTVNGSYNINSIVRTALGNYTVNFTNPISGNYAVIPAPAIQLGQSSSQWAVGLVSNQNANGFTIQYIGTNGANFDITTGTFVIFS